MALTPEQQAQLDAVRAKYGMAPVVKRLPVGYLTDPTAKNQYQNLLGPKPGDWKPLGRALDPAAIFRGKFGDIKGGIKEIGRNALDPAGVFGHDPKKVKGKIDPATGTVTVKNYGKYNEQLSNAFTNYLRTGDKGQLQNGGGAYMPLKRQIQQMQKSGYQYQAPSAAMPQAGAAPVQHATPFGPKPMAQPAAMPVAMPRAGSTSTSQTASSLRCSGRPAAARAR